ncbi:hypothetical protein AX16_009969 [Volvariella volvacea WC 439]|nr:hypothetical protein AX16_009969 [Volvariella volvacea WC 439]
MDGMRDAMLLAGTPYPYYHATRVLPAETLLPPRHGRRSRWIAAACIATIAFLALGCATFYYFGVLLALVRVSEIPGSVSVVECTSWNWENPSIAPSISYKLPINSTKLFLYSRGYSSRGTINFDFSNAYHDQDHVYFDVFPRTQDSSFLSASNVCRLRGPRPNQNGIGIFVETPYSGSEHKEQFTILVTIPGSTGPETRVIEEFETDLKYFEHHIEEMTGGIRFNKLTLRSGNEES